MENSLLKESGRKLSLILICGLVAVSLYIVIRPQSVEEVTERIQGLSVQTREILQQAREIEAMLNSGQEDKAESLLKESFARAKYDSVDKQRVFPILYALEGELNWRRWHFVDAERSWAKAERMANAYDREKIEARIVKVKKVIEELNTEREFATIYEAAPGRGIAGRPDGLVVLVHVMLVDGKGENWSSRQRLFLREIDQRVSGWYEKVARNYAKTVSFTSRYFLVDRDPKVQRTHIGGFDDGFRNADLAARWAVQGMGYPSLENFLKVIREQERADQTILLFHLNRDDRSFALPCGSHCRGDVEYAFVFESARPKHWQAMEYAQAHESMHLFGADDLYRISAARNYAPRDIMNYASRNLKDSTVEPLSAYAIGLSRVKPATPFKVITHK